MNIEIDSVKFRQYAHDMLNIGRMDMLIQLGKVSDKISQRQAQKIYKANLAIWEKRGLIEGIKEGGRNSTKYYSRTELEILNKSQKYDSNENKN